MSGFLFFLLFVFLIGFAGFHIFLGLMAGAAFALGGTAWAILIASTCAICVGILAIFLFTGFWILILSGIIALWILLSFILFPIFLPILLPLLIVFMVISFLKRSHKNIRHISTPSSTSEPHDH